VRGDALPAAALDLLEGRTQVPDGENTPARLVLARLRQQACYLWSGDLLEAPGFAIPNGKPTSGLVNLVPI
jgi:hypothetical protein